MWDETVDNKSPNWELRVDRWVAVLGSMVPVALVLGVVVYEFFIGITGLVWLVSRAKLPANRNHITQNKLFWPLFSWFGVVLLSRIVNWKSIFLFGHDFSFVFFPLFAVAMWDVSARMPVHRYIIGGLLAGIVYAMLNLISAHIIGFDFVGKPLSRYVGKLNEGARIGGLCAYAAPFLILWSIFDSNLERRQRFWLVILGFIGALLLISSQVRTAALAALVGLIGGSFCLLISRKRLKAGAILTLIVLGGLGAWGVYRILPTFDSIYDRVYFWEVSWHVWLQHPIVGVGISSFNEAYRLVAESGKVAPFASPTGAVYHNVDTRHAHNLFLQLMACNGLLGIGVFGWLFWRVVRLVRDRCTGWHTGLMSWPFICVVIGLTGWNIYDPFYTTVVIYFLVLISLPADGTLRLDPDQP
jgi:O-Antigen ligase